MNLSDYCVACSENVQPNIATSLRTLYISEFVKWTSSSVDV